MKLNSDRDVPSNSELATLRFFFNAYSWKLTRKKISMLSFGDWYGWRNLKNAKRLWKLWKQGKLL